MPPERLQKRLARAGVASRRAAEELIRGGRVTVNGQPATLGQSVTDADQITVNGTPLEAAGPAAHTTLALHKPRLFLTTARDDRGRRTVMDAMPNIPGLHPVGRLDYDSEGLLLLSTDGDLTLQLTHPRYEHEKQYRVWLTRPLSIDDQEVMEAGVDLEDGRTAPAEVEPAEGGMYVTLREGRYRQVRRMAETLGYGVSRLLRVRVGGLWLGDLQSGEYAKLTEPDIHDLLHRDEMSDERFESGWRETRRLWG